MDDSANAPMSSLIDVGKKWEGRIIDGKFPLRKWLGGSDRSAVFLTERGGNGPENAAIKLIPGEVFSADNIDQAAQLSRWANTAKLSHPHLVRLFESGRTQIDGNNFLYVVMEYAEENLAQIFPQRPLSPEEVKEMLPPAAEVLAYLHQAGLAHGHIKPSNIMAVADRLKISSDSLRKSGERDKQAPNSYLAPEVVATGPTAAADVWSFGATLIAVLTQHEPAIEKRNDAEGAIPYVPQPFYGIVRQCLRINPKQRCTMNKILGKPEVQETPPKGAFEKPDPAKRSKVWLAVPVIAVLVLFVVWIGHGSRRHSAPPVETHTAESSVTAIVPPLESPVPPETNAAPARASTAKGKVIQEISPDISPTARRTITGHVKVTVHISVDASGRVSEANLVSPGPSRYFANQALVAARRWKFNPPRSDGKDAPSEWTLRFQFGRTSTEVSPAETKP
jgi:TonB family protein